MDHQASLFAGFANSFMELPERFFVRQTPAPAAAPRLVVFNHALAEALGLDLAGLDEAALAGIFSGNTVPEGAQPIAMAYAGHQFGSFVPQLGDGRAILLGEAIDRAGRHRDIQLKGAGRTHFSRGGDGRAALGPVLREYLVSEAMHALGVPTTRALAAVTTGDIVLRERALPGAVFTRVLASNVRVGTFQYFAARGDLDAIKTLADYVIARHYPPLKDAPNPYLALLEAAVEAQAALIARWMLLGFIHGVMNTDNMAISGETIDFGPCAFMDAYDPGTVFSSIDHYGRYAYANQPPIAQWNLARLAETLLPLLDADEARAIEQATAVIRGFSEAYEAYWLAGMRRKLGLFTADDGDAALAQSLLDAMHKNQVDFTLCFRGLCDGDLGVAAGFEGWAATYQARRAREGVTPEVRAAAMRLANPKFIPRNHLVEAALAAAVESADFGPFHELLAVLRRPYDDQAEYATYAQAPPPSEMPYLTYCGT